MEVPGSDMAFVEEIEELKAELSATKEKLSEALESNKAVWKELESVDYAGSMDEAVRYLKRENAELRKQLEAHQTQQNKMREALVLCHSKLCGFTHEYTTPVIEEALNTCITDKP